MTGVALITGSSRGIGLAAARELAKQGFKVALNGPSDDCELAKALATLLEAGANAIKVPFDVSDASKYDHALDAIENKLGALTTLVNNAGVGVLSRGDPLKVSQDSWDRCHNVNAKAMFFLTQNFVKRLLKDKTSNDIFRSIVNVSSSNAVAVAEPRAEYAASKAAAAMIIQVSKG